MKRHELEHVIRAAADITGDEIVVVGSQAVLGQFPDAPEELLVSLEADVYPRSDPSRADEIDGAIGDGSAFHETYGYYAHGVGPETPIAPAGWEDRLIPVPVALRGGGTSMGWCLEVHDLMLSKLAAGREHDLEFVRAALGARLVEPQQLHSRIELMPESHREQTRERLDGLVARMRAAEQTD
jgi:hypothetical protein